MAGRTLLRVLATLAALAAVVWLVDLRAVAARLGRLEAAWMAAFVALSVPLYLLYAWRWSFTAARVGAPLGFRRAWLDYYVSTLLNQVLPVGVAGDVVRGMRHGRRLGAGAGRPAAAAIVLERLSGLVALGLFVAASAAVWLVRGRRELWPIGALALALLLIGGVVAARLGRRAAADGGAALLAPAAIGFQLAVSTAGVALLLGLFACAARAAGAPIDLATALAVVPLVLLATTLPWAFGGWGAREATMAALYRLLGLDLTTGVAVSVTFGLLSLVAAAPGLVVLALPERRP